MQQQAATMWNNDRRAATFYCALFDWHTIDQPHLLQHLWIVLHFVFIVSFKCVFSHTYIHTHYIHSVLHTYTHSSKWKKVIFMVQSVKCVKYFYSSKKNKMARSDALTLCLVYVLHISVSSKMIVWAVQIQVTQEWLENTLDGSTFVVSDLVNLPCQAAIFVIHFVY